MSCFERTSQSTVLSNSQTKNQNSPSVVVSLYWVPSDPLVAVQAFVSEVKAMRVYSAKSSGKEEQHEKRTTRSAFAFDFSSA